MSGLHGSVFKVQHDLRARGQASGFESMVKFYQCLKYALFILVVVMMGLLMDKRFGKSIISDKLVGLAKTVNTETKS